jgi:hypothetical protein
LKTKSHLSLALATTQAFAAECAAFVILMQNDLGQELPVRVKVGEKVIGATLEADSFNTFVLQA